MAQLLILKPLEWNVGLSKIDFVESRFTKLNVSKMVHTRQIQHLVMPIFNGGINNVSSCITKNMFCMNLFTGHEGLVAFSVAANSVTSVGQNSRVPYDVVQTNRGQLYDSQAHEFLCLYAGFYLFSLSQLSTGSSSDLQMMKDGTGIAGEYWLVILLFDY